MRYSEVGQALSVLNRADKRRCILIIVLNLVGGLIEVALVGAIPLCVAVLSDRSILDRLPMEFGGSAKSASDAVVLLWMAIAVTALAGIKLAYFFAVYRYTLRTVHLIRVRLSKEMFDSYLHAPWTFHLQNNSSQLLRNCTSEISEYVHGVFIAGMGAIHGAIMLGAVLFLIVFTLPALAVVSLTLTLGSVGGLMLWLRKRLAAAGETSRLERQRMLSHVQEGLGNLVDARMLGKEDWFLTRYLNSATAFSGSQIKISFVSRMLPYTVEFVSILGLMLVVTLLAREAGSAAAAAPQVAIVGVGMVRLRQAVSQVASNMARFQYSIPSVRSITEHSIELASEPLGSNADEFKFAHDIQLDGVRYSYMNADCPVLNGVSVRIPRGSWVAFIGETGCGKSTVLQIILGLLPPDKGRVCADGVDIRTNLRGWRSKIGYVPQRIQLLDATIRENIALAETDIDDHRLQQAIRIAQLSAVIDDQPNGLDTVVGENGVRLSGGQRQRLGLARALYREPSIIILDEATSALDNETETAITRSLNRIPWVATRIVVAHRLSTVKDCDSIIMLRNGVVDDEGRFDELCERHTRLINSVG